MSALVLLAGILRFLVIRQYGDVATLNASIATVPVNSTTQLPSFTSTTTTTTTLGPVSTGRKILPEVSDCTFASNARGATDRDVAEHGYVMSPPTRALLCQRRVNAHCGSVMYEPQSVEGRKGFPKQGPPDGHIAGADRFHELDQYGPRRWIRVDLADNLCRESNDTYRLSIRWRYTTAHATEAYHLYATDETYDSSKGPLTRSHLRHVQTLPPLGRSRVAHFLDFNVSPEHLHREGSLLVIWDIADTANAFYQVIDYRLTIKEDAPATEGHCLDRERCAKRGFAKNRCDCHRFFRCWPGDAKSYEYACPGTLVYDERANQCNWRDRVEIADVHCF